MHTPAGSFSSLLVLLLPLICSSYELGRLPKAFDPPAFEAYAASRPGALAARYSEFLSKTAPLQLDQLATRPTLRAAGRATA